MKKNLPDIDKLFKAALDSHEETPSDKVWDALDRKLDKDKVIDFRKKYIHLQKIAIALIVLLIGAGVYTFITWKKHSELSNNNQKNKNLSNDGGTSPLSQTESKTVVPYLPPADKNIVINPVQKSSDLRVENKNKQNTLAASSNQSNDSNADITINAIKNNDYEISRKGVHQKVKSKRSYSKNLTTTPVSAKLFDEKKSGEIDLNKNVSSKVYGTKRKQKTVIRNGGFEEENVETRVPIANLKTARAMPVIQIIYPELLTIETSQGDKKLFVPVNLTLVQNLPFTLRNTEKASAKKGGSFTAIAFFSPNLSSDFLKDDDDHNHQPGRPDHDEDGDHIKKGEQHQSSSSFGLLLDYKWNQRWSLQTGLSLTNKTIGIRPKTIYAADDGNGSVKYLYNCSSGYTFLSSKLAASPAVGDSLQASDATNSLQYLGIPLTVKYNFAVKKINLFTSVGISFNILTKGRLTTQIEGAPGSKETNTSTKIIGLKSGYLGGSIGTGASYNITDRVALTFMPSYNFALTSINKGAAVKTYPNAISIAAGIIYKL